MSDLAAFLRARLDEDEATARAAGANDAEYQWTAADHESASRMVTDANGQAVIFNEGTPGLTEAEHIARHDPARGLREVAAKRAIVNRYEFAVNQVAVHAVNETAGYGPADPGWPLRADSHELDVRNLAAVYCDHPDYRQEWKL